MSVRLNARVMKAYEYVKVAKEQLIKVKRYKQGESYYMYMLQHPKRDAWMEFVAKVFVVGRMMGFSPEELDEYILESFHHEINVEAFNKLSVKEVAVDLFAYFHGEEVDL